MIEFARLKGKPVFIAEATPAISTATTATNGKTQSMIVMAWLKLFNYGGLFDAQSEDYLVASVINVIQTPASVLIAVSK